MCSKLEAEEACKAQLSAGLPLSCQHFANTADFLLSRASSECHTFSVIEQQRDTSS